MKEKDDNKGKITQGVLLLEGGSFRGIYTSGVLDVLLENDILMENVVGVSAGSLNSMGYISNQNELTKQLILDNCRNPRYNGYRALLENGGAIGFKYIFGDMLKSLNFNEKQFTNSKQHFIAAATNCLTGKTDYLQTGNCKDSYKSIQASASMQILCRKVYIDGTPYLDGGITTSFGLEYALAHDFNKIVVILTRPLNYNKQSGLSGKARIYHIMYRKYPKLLEALERTEDGFNKERELLKKLKKQGRVFIIEPKEELNIARIEHDRSKLENGYETGREDAMNSVHALQKFLKLEQQL